MKDPSGLTAVDSTSQLSADLKPGPLELFWFGKTSLEEFHRRLSGNPLNGDQKQERKGELADSSSKPFHGKETMEKPASSSTTCQRKEEEIQNAASSASSHPWRRAKVELSALPPAPMDTDASASSPSQAGDGTSKEACEPPTMSKRARFKLEKGYEKPRAGKCQDYYAWRWQRLPNKY